MERLHNPYAPPTAPVSDDLGERHPAQPASLIVATTIASIIGGFVTLLTIFGLIAAISNGKSLWSGVPPLVYGVASLASAVAFHRRQRRAAILWCTVCGLLLSVSLLARVKMTPTSVAIIAIFAFHFVAALLAVFAMKGKKENG